MIYLTIRLCAGHFHCEINRERVIKLFRYKSEVVQNFNKDFEGASQILPRLKEAAALMLTIAPFSSYIVGGPDAFCFCAYY